ncbi:LysE/ArgO family amino acid transporter [Lentzea sp. BCCO 10_0798]|uniref:LysE/ArgO family amino acid transporter n=1 Tax=Lentzea kristufekii TaxID=3095430 RepID=A0ABU4TKQ8_9PSEU|nr:LysE/ArgO family amino acid transporter [Lentzea sp. BCCO 10_0798]MDX8048865.1 LysE/ArgO family amino acid transporter [Lentzea sp. BCCO 10_0798]
MMTLIVAIGAQNAFVLRQGLRRHAVAQVVAVCALSDAILVAVGVAGFGVIVKKFPQAIAVAAVVGGIFLLGYGFLAARRAFRPSVLNAGTETNSRPVLTALALTWLNPHVYLDTLLLLGSIAAGRWLFGVGAVTASITWFVALGFGARLLSPLFAKPRAWRVLDGLIAAVMITLGVTLIAGS